MKSTFKAARGFVKDLDDLIETVDEVGGRGRERVNDTAAANINDAVVKRRRGRKTKRKKGPGGRRGPDRDREIRVRSKGVKGGSESAIVDYEDDGTGTFRQVQDP